MASEHDDDLLDIISDAIDESMDVDWTSRGGARHVLGALQIGGYIRTAAMDALIADSADMIAPVRIKYDDAAIEAVQTLLETGRVTLDDEGYLVATAALSAMSPAGEVERIVAWLRKDADLTEVEAAKINKNTTGNPRLLVAEWAIMIAMKRGLADAIERGDYRHD